jgi:hypothetical protein
LPALSLIPAACNVTLNPSNKCSTYEGKISLFLASDTTISASNLLARTLIAELLDERAIIDQVGNGLLRIAYVGPKAPGPVLVVGTSDGTPASMVAPGEDSPTNSVSIAATAASAAAFALIVGSIYYLRRKVRSHSPSSDSDYTHGPGISTMDDLNTQGEKERCTSPFSEMLPTAYRFSGNMSVMSGDIDNSSGSGLSAVLENPSGEQSSQGCESMHMSESGYTTEAAESDGLSFLDIPKALHTRRSDSPLLLGAKKREENVITAKAASVEYDEMSDVSASPNNSPKAKSAASPVLLYPSHDDENDESADIDEALIFSDDHDDSV